MARVFHGLWDLAKGLGRFCMGSIRVACVCLRDISSLFCFPVLIEVPRHGTSPCFALVSSFDKFAKMEQWMASHCVSMSIITNPVIEAIRIYQCITNNNASCHLR